MERRTSLVGIYGGTFDPIHLGHLHLAETLLKTFSFEHFYFIPTKQNPLKTTGPHISDAQRLELVKASLTELNDPRVSIDERELKRTGVSFTVDTLREIQAQGLPTDQHLTLIVGDEVFQQLPAWKNPQEIFCLAHFIVVKRTPAPLTPERLFQQLGLPAGHWDGARYIHKGTGHVERWIEPVEINALPYSSTEIREQLALGWKSKLGATMPQGIQRSVWLLIKENQLYRR